jgi:hypothetical protein
MRLMMLCGEKLSAAEEHLYRLEDAVDGFFQENPDVFRIGGQPDPKGSKYLFGVQAALRPLEMEWGIIIGDAIHCVRSCLDQLVYGLAAKPDDRTAFPICRSEKDWVTRAPGQLWSVPEGVIEIIHKAQPYHRGDANAMHPLAVIQALSNMDKHQTISTTALVPSVTTARVIKTVGIAEWKAIKFHLGRPYKAGAVIAECEIVPDDSGVEPQMQVKFGGRFDIGFGEVQKAPSINFKPVVPFVRDVLCVFAVTEVVGPVTNYLRDNGLLGSHPAAASP